LQSIQAQTFEDWECIVVSDGSPRVDEIRAAVEGMRDPRFRLVARKENGGPGAARNAGIREARADLVMCVDEDDQLDRRCLEQQIKELRRDGIDIVVCAAAYFGGKEGRMEARVPTLEEILHRQPLPPCGFLMKKATWETAGGWDEHVVLRGREDHEWWVRVVKNGLKLRVVEEALYYYRVPAEEGDKKKSLNLQARRQEARIRGYIIKKHRDLYERYPEAMKRYLREAYKRESECYWQNGYRVRAVLQLWRAALVSRWGKDFRAAMKASLAPMFGRRVTDVILERLRMVLRPQGRGIQGAE
jgi:glycosyltransferase involved in cell wall biosynthesis